MKIFAMADLHWGNNKEADQQTIDLAEKFCQQAGPSDVFVLAGDSGVLEKGTLSKCLNLFSGFPGVKLIIPGNHDLWTTKGNSEVIYKKLFPELIQQYGFHCLDKTPVVINDMGFVGNIGWYDYSFKNGTIKASEAFYESKGAGTEFYWNDGEYIKWQYSDKEFVNQCLHKLQQHIEQLYNRVKTMVIITHHLPFAELVPRDPRPEASTFNFCNAFMGSAKMGELFLKYDKIKYALCGHSHCARNTMIRHIRAINVGSTYKYKKVVELEI